MSYHIDIVPNQTDKPAILFRQAWREGKRIRRRTLANLSRWPPEFVEALRAVLKGAVLHQGLEALFTLRRALPHGHVAAVVGVCHQIGLPRLLHRQASRQRTLALAGVVSRLLSPGSKLAGARTLSPGTATDSLGALLGTGPVHGNEMLAMLDWLAGRQKWIEQSLARRHLTVGTLILYDVSSSYLEGNHCPLASYGYNRDAKKGKQQIVYGLLCSADGCPVAIEVFEGNTADPTTVGNQVRKIQKRFGRERVALVGDRGMLTTARIRKDLIPAGLDWVSALKTTDLRKLIEKSGADKTVVEPDALIPDTVAEIVHPDFPGERLLVCLNPRLRAERARKREALLEATESILIHLQQIVRRKGSRLRGAVAIARRVGRVANRRQVEKHFEITITDDNLTFARRRDRIEAEARLDGLYVVRTNLDAEALSAEDAVWAYKRLGRVERAFRNLKTGHLEVRPLYIYHPTRVRGHVFLCLLALYVQWHLRRQLAPLLFEDEQPDQARAHGGSPVEKAPVSDAAQRKAASKRTEHGLAVSSLDTLLDHLATLTLNEVVMPAQPNRPLTLLAEATPLQKKAFELLDVNPNPGPNVAISGPP